MDIKAAIATAQAEIRLHADAENAAIQKAYLKVPYELIGHRVPQLRVAAKAARKSCPKPPHDDLIHSLNRLWRSKLYEDKLFAILLAGCFETQFTADDVRSVFLPWARELVGWSLLDDLAIHVMGRVALREPILFEDSLAWVREDSMWVRRAALLIHLPAIRAGELRFDILRRSAEALVGEREFFITKALGWVLREMFDRIPDEAERLFLAVGAKSAPLTRREALRKLDPNRRDRLLARLGG